MKSISMKVARYSRMHGWANRILRVDLGDMRITAQEATPYVPDYLGARGIAAKIAWDEYPEPVGEFDPANPLMIFPGALTGSRSPYSGRTNVCAFSPQAYPHPWFTRSSVGARFGGELKRAGYDGIVVTGASDTPVRIRIQDDEVSILPADDLWGQDAMDTLDALTSTDGKGVRSLVIGPAGEHLSRIATIQTASSSACGQGGFGGVMGSKKLKAISVSGTGRVALANPKTITSVVRVLRRMLVENGRVGPADFGRDIKKLNRQLGAEGNGSAHCSACTESCLTPCAAYFQDVPGVVHDRKWSGSWFCIAAVRFPGSSEDDLPQYQSIFDWRLTRRAAFEMNVLSNRYSLNQFDILMGMVPWLVACQKAGLISEMNGRAMDWRSPEFWAEFLRATAYREGLGDALGEGGWSAARTLCLGEDLARRRYPGWGHAGHWDGHDGAILTFPFWLASTLQWMSDTRDPFSTGHGSLWPNWSTRIAAGLDTDAERTAALDQIRAIGQRLYHSPDAVDPRSGYSGKARVGYYHTLRPVIKDCVPVDDLTFPLIYSHNAPDHYWRLRDVEGVGEIEGPSVEYHLFRAGTGVKWSEEEFQQAAERVYTLERALQVRHWARDRVMDEMVLPYFEESELFQSPFLKKRYGLDREQFGPVMDEFYSLHGWDTEKGWPTQERLRELGLTDVYEAMVDGAAKAGKVDRSRRTNKKEKTVPDSRTGSAEAAGGLRVQRSGVISKTESRCLTCRECEVACSLYHEGECNPERSRIRIRFDDFVPGIPSIVVCGQCDWPACYYACIDRWDEPAITIDPATGARYVDPSKCRGCGVCMRACPLTSERPVLASKKVGHKLIYFKCDLCHNRIEGPICVEICPGEALTLVTADERPK